MSDLSQSQTASLVLNPGDAYRISTGGTATVKVIYGAPSGTTTITANFATFGPYDAPAKLDVTAVSGVASYSLLAAIPVTKVDGQFTDPVLQSLVSGAGNAKSSEPRILFIGDSITDYGSARETMTISTSVTPYGNNAFSIISLSWANGSGNSGTLFFDKAAQTLRWTASGDSAGAPVDVSRAGVYTISSGTSAKTITIVCRPRGYSGSTDGALTVTTTAQTELSRRSGKTYGYWAHAKAGCGFDISTLANGGSQIRDITESAAWQVSAGAYDAVVCLAGANDIPVDRTLAQIIADYSDLIPTLKAKAARVFMLTMLPRSSGMTAGRRQIMAAANKWLLSLRIQGVTVVNAFSRLVDPASATADQFSGALEDGLHPAIPGAEAVGEAVYLALADAFAFDQVSVASSQGDTYDAINNPQGNRLPAGGTFTGTAGTAGAGASGTPPTGWTVARESGADLLVVISQVARTDGLPGNMLRLSITNPGATSQTMVMNPSATTAVAAGQVWRTQCSVVPSALAGVQSIAVSIEPAAMSGRFVASWGQNNFAGAVLAGAKRKQVMEPWPLEMPAGAALANVYLRVTLAAGGSATLDLLPGEWTFWRES